MTQENLSFKDFLKCFTHSDLHRGSGKQTTNLLCICLGRTGNTKLHECFLLWKKTEQVVSLYFGIKKLIRLVK